MGCISPVPEEGALFDDHTEKFVEGRLEDVCLAWIGKVWLAI